MKNVERMICVACDNTTPTWYNDENRKVIPITTTSGGFNMRRVRQPPQGPPSYGAPPLKFTRNFFLAC